MYTNILNFIRYSFCINSIVNISISGSVVMYFAEGYVSRSRWFAVGFVMAAVYITIFLSVGMLWWKLLGWY